MLELLPRTVPTATAALIAGLSSATFRARCLDTGTVQTENGQVLLASLAAHLGHPITADAYLAAERRRDPARAAQRRYRETKRNAA
jgi:hypothetical protein